MNSLRKPIARRRRDAPWMTQEPREEARLAISAGLRELEDILTRQPPNGVTADDVATLFQRHRETLAASLDALLAKALAPPEPRCSVCRRRRGTNPACDRCQHFEWMQKNPIPREELEAEMAIHRQRQAEEETRDEERLAKLRGRVVRVALVGCGKVKMMTPQPAKDLYIGPLFKAARAYAEQQCDDWVILSAKHGVVLPDNVIEPYDQRLSSMRLRDQEDWARKANQRLRYRYRGLQVQFIGLAGEEYLDWLGGEIIEPLKGMGIGTRIKFLRDATCKRCASSGEESK